MRNTIIALLATTIISTSSQAATVTVSPDGGRTQLVLAMADEKEDELLALLVKVNDRVNKAPYITDQEQFGQKQHVINSLQEFMDFEDNGGDCEDFAMVKAWMLKARGVTSYIRAVEVVKGKYKGLKHAVVIVPHGGVEYVLDVKSLNPHVITWPETNGVYKIIEDFKF